MSERQKDRPTDSLTDRQTDRQTERQIEDKTTFQLSYQNKSCSECQQDVKKSVRQIGRYTVRQADRVTDRQNDSMTVWQNSRAAKEPALVLLIMVRRTNPVLGVFRPLRFGLVWLNASSTKATHSGSAGDSRVVP